MAEASENKQAAKKVENSLIAMTKGESNTNLNMELVMRSYANWEHFLTPAPMSIAMLGELMIIASETDFSLAKNPPTEGFQHMKHPSSFRASLLQVSNAAYVAFDQANSSMDQIRIRTLAIPSDVKNALKIIIAGENNEIKSIVPRKLVRIKESADNCLQLAKETESKFQSVMLLIAEILEACTKTQGENDQEVATALTTIKFLKERVERYQQEQQNEQKDLQELKEEVRKAHKQIEAAMDGMPSAWETLGMSVISAVTTGLVHKFTGMLGCVATATAQLQTQIIESAKEFANSSQDSTLNPDQAQPTTPVQKANSNVFGKCSEILKFAEILSDFIIKMKSGNEQETKLKLSQYIQDTEKGSKYVQLQFNALREEVEREIDADEGVRGPAIEICTTGVEIAQDLTKLNGEMNQHQNEIEEIRGRVKKLIKEAQLFQTRAMKWLKVPPFPSTTPQHAVAQEKCALSAGQDVSIAFTETARFKTEQAISLLKNAEERHDKMAKEMREKNEAIMNLMQEMSKQDVRRLDLDTIRSTLSRGMTSLARIRDQWAKLVEFFKMMSHIMECALTESLEKFTITVDGKCEDKTAGPLTLSQAVRDVLFEEAYMAIKISHLVNMLSTTYCEVSKDHIMGRIGVLYHIVAMDPKYQLEDMKHQQKQLLHGCQEAQRKIQELACSNAEEFHATIQGRINRIEHEVNALLPPPATPEAAAAIEQKRVEIKEVIARADQEEDQNVTEWL